MDVALGKGNGDLFLVKGQFHPFQHVKVDPPVIIAFDPDPDQQIDGAVGMGGDIDLGSRFFNGPGPR